MTSCATCGGQLVDRDLDYGACCLQCGRPGVKPQPPAWLLTEEDETVARVVNFTRRFRRRAVRAAAATVASVTYEDMRAAMAVLR